MQQNIDKLLENKKIRCNWVEMSFSVHLGKFWFGWEKDA
jgi:hypothetical protein